MTGGKQSQLLVRLTWTGLSDWTGVWQNKSNFILRTVPCPSLQNLSCACSNCHTQWYQDCRVYTSYTNEWGSRFTFPEGFPDWKANPAHHEVVLEVFILFLHVFLGKVTLISAILHVMMLRCRNCVMSLWPWPIRGQELHDSRPPLSGCDRSDSIFFRPSDPKRGGLPRPSHSERGGLILRFDSNLSASTYVFRYCYLQWRSEVEKTWFKNCMPPTR